MEILITLLSVVLLIVCVLMILIVLMQRPKQEGLGAAFGGGMTDQMFGAQTTNVLQKGTVWLAVMFFFISLVLSIIMARTTGSGGALPESLTESDPVPVPEAPAAGAGALPGGITLDPSMLPPGTSELNVPPMVEGSSEAPAAAPAPADGAAAPAGESEAEVDAAAKPKTQPAAPAADDSVAKPEAGAKPKSKSKSKPEPAAESPAPAPAADQPKSEAPAEPDQPAQAE